MAIYAENTNAFVEALAEKIILSAKRELGANRKRPKYSFPRRGKVGTYSGKIDSTGRLRNSLEAKIDEETLSMEFIMEDYGQWVDEGRKRGKGAPVKSIDSWIRNKGLRLRDENGQFIRKTEKNIRAAGFLFNRKLKYFGIAATHFFSEPFNVEMGNMIDGLTDNMIKDIENHIGNKFSQNPGTRVEDI